MRRAVFLSLVIASAACRKPESSAALLRRLPTQDATVLSLDVHALRQAGLLKLLVNKTAEEPEYQAFIHNSGFDYQRDLDSALIAFAPSGTFFIAQGRFDWQKLATYAQANGGGCYNRLCRLPGSTPERRISFLPLSETSIALAVSTDDLAASRLTKPGAQREIIVPPEPLWLSIPSTSLRKPGWLPGAAQVLAGALSGTEQMTLALGPASDGYQVRLDALCKSPAEAKVLADQLTKVTRVLQAAVKQKNADDLVTVLAEGSFSRAERNVSGRWPIRKSLIAALAPVPPAILLPAP